MFIDTRENTRPNLEELTQMQLNPNKQTWSLGRIESGFKDGADQNRESRNLI